MTTLRPWWGIVEDDGYVTAHGLTDDYAPVPAALERLRAMTRGLGG